MRAIYTTVAVVLLAISPLLAANEAKIIGLPFPGGTPAVVPQSVNVGFLATTVLMGQQDPEGLIPCFNCVSGVDIQTLLIALPLAAIRTGAPIEIVVSGDNLFYGGTAAFTYAFKANPTVAPVSTETVAGAVSPGIWIATFPISAPAPGVYILEGDIATGENLRNHTTVSTQVIIGQAQD